MNFMAAINIAITGKERSNKLAQVATLQTCICEVTGYNIRWDTRYSDQGFISSSFFLPPPPPAHPGEHQDSTSY
jgi:hypothetical protein